MSKDERACQSAWPLHRPRSHFRAEFNKDTDKLAAFLMLMQQMRWHFFWPAWILIFDLCLLFSPWLRVCVWVGVMRLSYGESIAHAGSLCASLDLYLKVLAGEKSSGLTLENLLDRQSCRKSIDRKWVGRRKLRLGKYICPPENYTKYRWCQNWTKKKKISARRLTDLMLTIIGIISMYDIYHHH